MARAAAATDAGVVEQQWILSVSCCRDLVAEAVDLSSIGDVGDVRGDALPCGSLSASQSRLVSAMFGERSHMATLQPSATSCRASSRPIPVPPPVITAIFAGKVFMEFSSPLLMAFPP